MQLIILEQWVHLMSNKNYLIKNIINMTIKNKLEKLKGFPLSLKQKRGTFKYNKRNSWK